MKEIWEDHNMKWEVYTTETKLEYNELVLGFFQTYPACYYVGYIYDGLFHVYDGYTPDWKRAKPMNTLPPHWTPKRIIRLYPK